MYPLNKHNHSTTSHMRLSDNGLITVPSNTPLRRVAIEDIIFPNQNLSGNAKLSMLGYHPTNNLMTSPDKLKPLKNYTPLMKSSQTLPAGLTSKGGGLYPFWKDSLKKNYRKLWLPTQTDLQGLALNSSSLYSTDLGVNLELYQKRQIQSKPFRMTSYQSSQSLPLDTTAHEIIKTRKIRIYPTKNQQKPTKKTTKS